MDCRAFRKRHLAFVDDTLPGVDIGRMQSHLSECQECAAWDYRVRRSLLVARNQLRPIQPSPEFSGRLAARLEQERRNLGLVGTTTSTFRWHGVAAVALTLAVVGVSSLVLGSRGVSTSLVRLPAVVYQATDADIVSHSALPNATPAFMASMSTGMAILPALMLAEEVPVVQANNDGSVNGVRTAGYTVILPDQR